jgi:hypothetical protein
MPSKTPRQRRFIFAIRRKYVSKSDTPKKWKWVWGKEWTKLEESIVLTFGEWLKNNI